MRLSSVGGVEDIVDVHESGATGIDDDDDVIAEGGSGGGMHGARMHHHGHHRPRTGTGTDRLDSVRCFRSFRSFCVLSLRFARRLFVTDRSN
jgi:hypothetical protein